MNVNNLVKIILEQQDINYHHYKDYIKPGQTVAIIQKHHQSSNKLTIGVIKRILTKKPKHTRGIKVQLTTGEVGRVQEIIDDAS